jgi:hypothetical protein
MKTKNFFKILILSLIFSTISCENKGKENSNEESQLGYSVKIEGQFLKNDKIQVYYLAGEKWEEENSVFFPVYGNPSLQTLDIKLPSKVKPSNIRIDISSNKTQQNVSLKNISVLKDGELLVDGDNELFSRYFILNEYITWDNDFFGYKVQEINGIYDPYFIGNDTFVKKMNSKK